MVPNKKRILIITTFSILIFILCLVHNVNKKVLPEDIIYIQKVLGYTPPNISESSFEDQLLAMSQVRDSLFKRIELKEIIPFFHTREPKDLYQYGAGCCYDRSRFLEKTLSQMGMEVRHVALFYKKEGQSAIKILTTKSVFSHAITEVKTVRGWMIIDPNVKWFGLYDGKPLSMKNRLDYLEKNPGVDDYLWDYFYAIDCLYVYGLYSRHGNSYPPYNFIPDVNFMELTNNFSKD